MRHLMILLIPTKELLEVFVLVSGLASKFAIKPTENVHQKYSKKLRKKLLFFSLPLFDLEGEGEREREKKREEVQKSVSHKRLF